MLDTRYVNTIDYNNLSYNFLVEVESQKHNVPDLLAYADPVGIATIGVGFNLRLDSNRLAVLAEMTNGAPVPTQLNLDIKAVVDQDWTGNPNGLRNALNNVMTSWNLNGGVFSLIDNAHAQDAYAHIIPSYEAILDYTIPGLSPASYERVALLSLTYNNPSLLGPNLVAAVNGNNRAEAWYEIRYQSNAGHDHGIAKRRYYESEMFSLYKDRLHVTDKEATDFYKMYERHEQYSSSPNMISYDKTYANDLKNANTDYATGLSMLEAGKVENRDESMAPAHDYLVATYAHGAHIDNIYVDYIPEGGTVEKNAYAGTAKDDLILGGDGNDVLNGGAGNDFIDGGVGVDVVHGGIGDDTLLYRVADNSLFSPTDELLYGDAGMDTLTLNLANTELTNALRDDILAAYTNWTTVQTGPEKSYDFAILKLQAFGFESLTVNVDGVAQDLATLAHDDHFALSKNGSLTGNLLADNGQGADYTFGSSLTIAAGQYTTVDGGTITIHDDGSFAYLAHKGFTGVDDFVYSVKDTSGAVCTGQANFEIQQVINGTANGDLIYSENNQPMHVNAGDGNDSIDGSRYGDYLNGGNGNDDISGISGSDTLIGGQGDDSLGVGGYDWDSQGHPFQVYESLSGGAGNDNMAANYGHVFADGGTGNDTIVVTGIADMGYGDGPTTATLHGGDGNDTLHIDDVPIASLYGDGGNDTFIVTYSDAHPEQFLFDGGSGIDTLEVGMVSSQGDSIDLFHGTLVVGGVSGSLLNIENVIGLDWDDTITGSAVANVLSGGDGNDVIKGGSGNDTLDGGAGDDLLYGQDGVDNLTGGSGADTFVFEAAFAFKNIDTIADFHASEGDKINVADLLKGFVQGVSNINDFVTFTTLGTTSHMFVDRDGTGTAYKPVEVAILSNVSASDTHDILNGHIVAS